MPVPVSSRDGHSYYGVLGYFDTQGGACACPGIVPGYMVIVTTAYWDTLTQGKV